LKFHQGYDFPFHTNGGFIFFHFRPGREKEKSSNPKNPVNPV